LDEELLHKVSSEFMKMAKREKFVVLDTAKNATEAFAMVKAHLGGIINE
jgi:hypothetical protein